MGALVQVWSHVLRVVHHLCVFGALTQDLGLQIELGQVDGVFLLGLGTAVDQLWFHCELSEFFLHFLLGVALEVLEVFVAALEFGLAESLDYLALDWHFYHAWRGKG